MARLFWLVLGCGSLRRRAVVVALASWSSHALLSKVPEYNQIPAGQAERTGREVRSCTPPLQTNHPPCTFSFPHFITETLPPFTLFPPLHRRCRTQRGAASLDDLPHVDQPAFRRQLDTVAEERDQLRDDLTLERARARAWNGLADDTLQFLLRAMSDASSALADPSSLAPWTPADGVPARLEALTNEQRVSFPLCLLLRQFSPANSILRFVCSSSSSPSCPCSSKSAPVSTAVPLFWAMFPWARYAPVLPALHFCNILRRYPE